MKKFRKIILSITLALVALFSFGMTACSQKKEKTTLTGCYYTETLNATSQKRGCDLYVILNPDNSIYTIALDDESPYACADMQVLWSIKSSGFFNNVASLGIDGIKKLEVVCGADGVPTGIKGMDPDWLVPMNVGGCGFVVLALQDAFKGM